MNLGKYIIEVLEQQGRSKTWLADKMNINVKTFVGKLKRDSITGQELLRMAEILNIDLEELKNKECVKNDSKRKIGTD
jgi:hypothetical protein